MEFCYQMGIFFQNNPKNLDPSYDSDKDYWVVLEGINPLQQNKVHVFRIRAPDKKGYQ